MSEANLLVRTAISIGKNTPFGRGKARRQLLRFIESNTQEPFTTQVMGCPFVVHFDNETERKILFDNYNRDELEFLIESCDGRPSTFFDIGANCGYYTSIMASRLATGSTIIAIEANPEMVARANTNIAMLKDVGKANDVTIRLEACAVGEQAGSEKLFVGEGPNKFGGAHISTDGTGIDIEMQCLEQIVQQNAVTEIDALKIDIEGYEDMALLPFFEKAPKSLFPKAVVIEHSSEKIWRRDLLGTMRDLGYVEVRRNKGNAMLRLSQ